MIIDILLIYLILLNLFGFFMMGLDKWKAKKSSTLWKKSRRVKEKHLFLIAGLGGSLGIFAGMYYFRHKTKHKSFIYVIPVILILQIICLILLLYY